VEEVHGECNAGGAEVGSKVQDFSINGVMGRMGFKKIIKDKIVFFNLLWRSRKRMEVEEEAL